MRAEHQPRRQQIEIVDGKPCQRGHGTKRYARFGGCVECVRLANKKRRLNTPIEMQRAGLRSWRKSNREYSNAARVEWHRNNPERSLLSAARSASKSAGVPFNLELSDIVIPERCPVFDIPLERATGDRKWSSPSLDRIIPAKGYTKGNVVIVSWRANRIKSDASLRELELLTSFYQKMMKG